MESQFEQILEDEEGILESNISNADILMGIVSMAVGLMTLVFSFKALGAGPDVVVCETSCEITILESEPFQSRRC